MRIPNVVIAGAPKCGSTSLYYYLDSHPEACGSDVKETCFLMDQEFLTDPANAAQAKGSKYLTHGLEGYSSYFTRCNESEPCVLFESTPGYMYQQTALKVLPSLTPPVKLVFILRRPSARMWSLYTYATGNLAAMPKDMTFPEFIAWLKKPRDKNLVVPIAENEYHYSKYVNYLIPFKERCRDGQMVICLAEDLKRDPAGFMKQLCTEIGLDPSFYDTYQFVRHNESFRPKNQLLQKVRRQLSHALPNSDFRKSGIFKAFLHLYDRVNGSSPLKKTTADEECLAQLDMEYRPYCEHLAREFDLDLSSWGIPVGEPA
jgi:Sulfotransferase domain